MSSFFEGVIAGFGIAIPVGAIGILIVDTGLRRGLGYGFMAGAGAATADLVYAAIAALAGAALAVLIAPYATSLALVSAIVLLSLGGFGLHRAYRMAHSKVDHPNPIEVNQANTGSQSHFKVYLRFLGLTLLNPLTVAYFAALILGRDAATTTTWFERLAFVLGAFLASLSWQSVLAATGALAGRYLSPRFQLYATIGGNLVVMLLGLRILLQVIQ